MNHHRLIGLSVLLISVVFLFMWTRLDSPLSDFGLNGFTEALGIGITVFLVDLLQKKREEKRLIPQRRVAYEDVRVLVARIIAFWQSAYLSAVPKPLPASVSDLLSKSCIEQIGSCLDMDSRANVTPSRTWWDYLPQELQDFRQRATVILERHNGILDPAAYHAVHQIAHSGMEPGLVHGIRASDQEMGFPRIRILGNYCFFLPDYFSSVLELVEWCNSEADAIERVSSHKLLRIAKDLSGAPHSTTPPCMIKPENLAAQLNALKVFRERESKQQSQRA